MFPSDFHRGEDEGASAPSTSTRKSQEWEPKANAVGMHTVRMGNYILLCHVKLEDPTGWVQLQRIGPGWRDTEDIYVRQDEPCEGCGEHHWIFQGVCRDGEKVRRAASSNFLGLPEAVEEAMEHCYEQACADLQTKVERHGVPDGTAPETIPEEWL